MKNTKRLAIFLATTLITTCGFTLNRNKKEIKEFTKHINTCTKKIDENDDFLISAHRGFSSLEIENTKDAITLAASKNYIDYIELDARLTEDNKIVLSHNNLLLSNTEIIPISSLSYEEATSNDFSYQNCYISPYICINPEYKTIQKRKKKLNMKNYNLIGLKEGIESCENKKILLDIKFDDNKEIFTEELIKELNNIDTSNIIFQSLDLESLKYFKEQTNYNCLALINCKKDFKYIKDFDNVGIKYSLIDHDKIEEYLNENKTVAIWTINNNKDLDEATTKLQELYTDVIYITDYPDLIVTELYDKQKKRDH